MVLDESMWLQNSVWGYSGKIIRCIIAQGTSALASSVMINILIGKWRYFGYYTWGASPSLLCPSMTPNSRSLFYWCWKKAKMKTQYWNLNSSYNSCKHLQLSSTCLGQSDKWLKKKEKKKKKKKMGGRASQEVEISRSNFIPSVFDEIRQLFK